MAKELEWLEEGPKVEIHINLLRTTLKKYHFGKCQNTWILVFHHHLWQTSTWNEQRPTRSIHTQMDDQRKDHIDPKRPHQRTAPNNFRPITCLPMTWKILMPQIREEIYYSLISCWLFLEEQKGCCKGSRDTGELLDINQYILNEIKIRRKNLAMAWIDYKMAYDMVL